MQRLLHDLRFALRQLRKSPGFAVTTILTLALGIGATTTIFSLVNAVLLRPLPFPQQDRLVWLQIESRTSGVAVPGNVSYPDFFDWRSQQRSFSGLAAYRSGEVTLTGVGEAKELTSEIVSKEFFQVLGVHPQLGREFRSEEEKPDAHAVILSHQLWQSTFGGAPDIVGRAITLDGASYTVAGVMPQDFAFPIQNPPIALWTSIGDDKQFFPQRGADVLEIIGRLKPDASLAGAKAQMDVIARNLAAQYPDSNKQQTAVMAKPVLEQLVGDTRPALRILFAAVTLVLLIACANVAGLLLARASRRRTDIALQAALGASPREIIRQILVESVILSMIAGACGIALSLAAMSGLPRLVPKNMLPRMDHLSVDGAVLAFAVAASVLTGLLFGVLPAWRMSRFDPLLALREGSRGMTSGRRQYRMQSWLLVAETALGLVLLVGSGLLIRSFVRVLDVDPGFDAHGVLTTAISLPGSRFPRQQKIEFYHRLFARLSALPGVQSVSAGFPLPLSGNNIDIDIAIEGRPVASGDQPSEKLALVLPDFFRTLRIPILAGRAFTAADSTTAKQVIIINDRFARKYFPGENPIGKHVQAGIGDGTIKSLDARSGWGGGKCERRWAHHRCGPGILLALGTGRGHIASACDPRHRRSSGPDIVGAFGGVGHGSAGSRVSGGHAGGLALPILSSATLSNLAANFFRGDGAATLRNRIVWTAVLHGGATFGRDRTAGGVGRSAQRRAGPDSGPRPGACGGGHPAWNGRIRVSHEVSRQHAVRGAAFGCADFRQRPGDPVAGFAGREQCSGVSRRALGSDADAARSVGRVVYARDTEPRPRGSVTNAAVVVALR